MIVDRRSLSARKHTCHQGVASVEFACCLPLLVLILAGLWQVGRYTEVQQVLWNAAREGARDASLGEDNLQTVAGNILTYLQGAEPTAFRSGHSTSLIAPTVSLPANTYGYTCWDNTTNSEVFTMTFTDLTTPSVTDPTAMNQLDMYQIGIQVPFPI
jgi:Flp pilus assembly protein TadG